MVRRRTLDGVGEVGPPEWTAGVGDLLGISKDGRPALRRAGNEPDIRPPAWRSVGSAPSCQRRNRRDEPALPAGEGIDSHRRPVGVRAALWPMAQRCAPVAWLLIRASACSGDRSAEIPASVHEVMGALATARPFELRLSGSHRQVECAPADSLRQILLSVCPGGQPDIGLLRRLAALASEAQRGAEHATSTDALWSGAIIDLVSHPHDPAVIERSIGRLREVVARDSANAPALSDLGVALGAKASAQDDPRTLFEALHWVELAHLADSANPLILYNRAVILERLHLVGEAAEAWSVYLQRAEPGWSAEADTRREVLAKLDERPTGRMRLEAVRARGGLDSATAAAVAADEPEALREVMTEVLLPQWAGAVLHDSTAVVARVEDEIGVLANLLADRGDSIGRLLARRLSSPHDRLGLAGAVATWGRGLKRFRNAEFEAAEPELSEALRLLGGPVGAESTPEHVALAAWPQLLLAASEMYRRRYDVADGYDRATLAAGTRYGFSSLVGLAGWNAGISRTRQGFVTEGLRHYL